MQNLDREGALTHEEALLIQATEPSSNRWSKVDRNSQGEGFNCLFFFDDIHAHDVGTFLDAGGIAIRTGHHCTMPLLKRFNVPATARASFAFYNNTNDVDCLVESLKKMKSFFL